MNVAHKIRKLLGWISIWKGRGGQFRRLGARLPDGSCADSLAQAAYILASHWRHVFDAPVVDLQPTITLSTNFVVSVPSNVEYKLSLDDFIGCVLKRSDSSPGPNGIPYSCWRAAPTCKQEGFHDASMLCYVLRAALLARSLPCVPFARRAMKTTIWLITLPGTREP